MDEARDYVNTEFFPMIGMRAETLLTLDELEPFTVCKNLGLTERVPPGACVVYISHQWLESDEPDPDKEQLRAAQRLLQFVVDGYVADVFKPADWHVFAEGCDARSLAIASSAKCMHVPPEKLTEESFGLQVRSAYVWWECFSIPEVCHKSADHNSMQHCHNEALRSIPYYLERSSFFVVSAPVEHPKNGRKVSRPSGFERWRRQGWCRFEEWANYLSVPHHMTPIVVTEMDKVYVLQTADFMSFQGSTREGAVWCGEWQCCMHGHISSTCYKLQCFKILQQMWAEKFRQLQLSESWRQVATLAALETKLFATHCGNCFFWAKEGLADFSHKALVETFLSKWGFCLDDPEVPSVRCPVGSPMNLAAALGDERLLATLVARRCRPDVSEPVLGMTTVCAAAVAGSVPAMRLLLGQDSVDEAFVNRGTRDQRITPVDRAAASGHQEILKLLLENRADVHATRLDNGHTPLHSAAARGMADCSRILVESCAQLDATDFAGSTPLHLAVAGFSLYSYAKGRRQVAELLVEFSASVVIRDGCGLSPVDVAQANGDRVSLELLKAVESAFLLVGHSDVACATTPWCNGI